MTAEGAHAAVHGESPLVFVQLLGSSQAGLGEQPLLAQQERMVSILSDTHAFSQL